MYNEAHVEYLLTLPVAQFKAIQKAVRVLTRVGVPSLVAIDTIIKSHQEQKFNNKVFRADRQESVALRQMVK
jgi:hypothetical protein